MPISKSTQLVKSFLEYCDIPSQPLDEENKVLLSIDYEFNILIVIENRLIYLISAVGKISKSETLYRNLLVENYKNPGYTNPRYSIDPNSNELIVSISVDGHLVELNRYIKIAEDFVGLCEEWMRFLNTGNTDIPHRALRWLN